MSAATVRVSRLRLVSPEPAPAAPARNRPASRLARQAIALEDAVREQDVATLTALVEDAASGGISAHFHASELRRLNDSDARDNERLSRALASGIALLTARGGKASQAVLARLRAAFGETGLMLSGGGKLGNYHIGVVRLLLDEGLLPRIISGSSAGSLIAALIGTRTDEALGQIMADEAHALAEVGEAELDEKMFSALTQTSLRKTVERLIPDWTFAQAQAHSGRSINIAAAGNEDDGTGMIFSASTTPHALIRDAVMASCAVPYVYPPVQIGERLPGGRERDYGNGQFWMDGSVDADMPADWLRSHYGVRRLIASVVNPFELPMLTDPDHHGPFLHSAASFSMNIIRSFWSTSFAMALPVMRHVPVAGRVIALSRRVLDQRVEADVIIAPGQRIYDLTKLIQHATLAQLASFITEGERATRARMKLMAPSLRIERALAG